MPVEPAGFVDKQVARVLRYTSRAGLRFYKIRFYKIKNPNTRISTHIHYYMHTIVLYRVVLYLVETNLVETKACPHRVVMTHTHIIEKQKTIECYTEISLHYVQLVVHS